MTGASVVPLSICVQSIQFDPSSGVGHFVVINDEAKSLEAVAWSAGNGWWVVTGGIR